MIQEEEDDEDEDEEAGADEEVVLPEGMELDPVVMSTLPPSMQVLCHNAHTRHSFFKCRLHLPRRVCKIGVWWPPF